MADTGIWHSQNFIRSPSVVGKIIRVANLSRNDLVVEIGPGTGIITRELAKACSQVIAVEYDRSLYDRLRRTLGRIENLDVICADFRQYELPDREYKVVANIPFKITSEIMAKITTSSRSPREAYVVMQAEAARRFAGAPYDHESLRSLLIKTKFELSIVHRFRKTDFRPTPKVDVVLLGLRKRHHPMLSAGEDQKYRELLCFVFSEQGRDVAARLRRIFTRPQMKRLARDNGFSMSARVVDLSFAQWLAIFRYYLRGAARDRQKLVEGAEKRLLRRQTRLTKVHRSRTVPGWKCYSADGRRSD